MTNENMDYVTRLLRLFHPEKKYSFLQGADKEEALSAMHGIPVDTFRKIKQGFTENAYTAAEELVAQDRVRHALESIPIFRDARIIVIGDSLTDDYQSWFEIIQHAFQLVRAEDNVQFINTATSGDTSAQMLASVVRAVDMQPDMLICAIGTNDARVQGAGGKQCTTLGEVEKNIDAIAAYARQNTDAPLVWITPSGVNEARIEADWLLNKFKASWSNRAIDAIADLIVQRDETCLDLRPHFKARPDLDPFAEDGLHWSLAGQKLVAQLVIQHLARHVAPRIEQYQAARAHAMK